MAATTEFMLSAYSLAQLPRDNLPEIALAGRSNVGKSSLINRLLARSNLARTSNTPGRTQALNYYRVLPEGKTSEAFYLVDMPGYGFAAAGKVQRRQWGELIESYLRQRETLCAVIMLVDLRHPPQPLDHVMIDWLRESGSRYLVIGTKADKIAKTKVPEAMLRVAEDLHIDSNDTLAFSAASGLGRAELWDWIVPLVAECRA